MNRVRLRMLLCLLTAVGAAFAGSVLGLMLRTRNAEMVKASRVGPPVYFDETAIMFGTVPQNKVLNGTFNFKNVSSKNISIKRINTSCGCLATYAQRAPVLPGGAGAINVQLSTDGIAAPSKLSKLIDVEFEPGTSSVQLMVCADVGEDLSVNPKRIVFEKNVTNDSTRKAVELTIHRGLLSPIQFTQVQLVHPSYYLIERTFANVDLVVYHVTLHKHSPVRLSPLEITYSDGAKERRKIRVPATVKLTDQMSFVPNCYFEIVTSADTRQYNAKKKRCVLMSKDRSKRITRIEASSEAEKSIFGWELEGTDSFYIWIKQLPVATSFSGSIKVFFEDESKKSMGELLFETFVLRNFGG